MGTQTRFLSKLAHTLEADFEAIYQNELPRVYNFFRYRVGDDQIAEDLTAETFEKACRNRERYRSDLAARRRNVPAPLSRYYSRGNYSGS
jgi:DNA-directed RNA polymerase specialized sigma24 family protein